MQPPPGSLVWWTSWGGPPWAIITTGTPRCTLRITGGSSPLTSPASQPVLWRLWEVTSNTEPRPPSSTITLSTRVCQVDSEWLMSVCESLSPPGHTDHSEVNLGAPLVSISLGLPAIFLIGGPGLDTVPCPLLLRWPGCWLMVTCVMCHVIQVWWCSGDGAPGPALLPRRAQDPVWEGQHRQSRGGQGEICWSEVYWGKGCFNLMIFI